MPIVLWVAAGGAIGASGRYFVNVYAGRLAGTGFPWGTLSVNILGSFIMGAMVTAMALKLNVNQEMRAFLTTGVLGGFTTFSAFSLDFALMVERGDWPCALLYALASVGISLLAIFAGLWLARAVLA